MAWFTAPSGVTCVAAYDAIGASSLADSYVNEANPGTYDLIVPALATAPAWAYGTGWTFNGTTDRLSMGADVLSGATGWTVIFRCTITAGAKRGIFNVGGSGAQHVVFVESDRQFSRTSTNVNQIAVFPTGSQFVGAYGVSASAHNVYVNGSSVASGGGVVMPYTSPNLAYEVFGVRGGTSGVPYYFLGLGAAMAVYTAKLPADDITAVTAAMNALPSAGGSIVPIVPIVVAAHGAYLGAGGML